MLKACGGQVGNVKTAHGELMKRARVSIKEEKGCVGWLLTGMGRERYDKAPCSRRVEAKWGSNVKTAHGESLWRGPG